MLETNDLVLILTVNAVFTCLVSAFCVIVTRLVMDWMLYRRLQSCENSVKGMTSGAVRGEKRDRINGAILRAAELYKEVEGRGEKPDLLKLGAQVAMEYPDIALQLPSELQKWSRKMGLTHEQI